MFNRYNQEVIRLEKVFLEKYQYSYSGNLTSLVNLPFIELEGDGKDALCWIIYDQERYLFKPIMEGEYNVWGEIISMMVAKMMNIPCAEYRIASLGNITGVLSKSFLKKEDTLILGTEIYQRFLNKRKKEVESLSHHNILKNISSKSMFYYLNNLSSTSFILDYSAISSEQKVRIEQELSRMLLFDLITLQGDRHSNNWGIIFNDNTYRLCPLFDNSASFGLGYPMMKERIERFRSEKMNARRFGDNTNIYSLIYQASPDFTLNEENILDINKRKKDKIPKVFSLFYQKLDDFSKEKVEAILDKFDGDSIDLLLKEAEMISGMKMDEDVFYYIAMVLEMNICMLKEIIQGLRRESSNHAVQKNRKTI